MLFNFMHHRVSALQKRVLTGTGMNNWIEHVTKRHSYQFEQQTTAMTSWDVVVSWCPIVSVQRRKTRGNEVAFEEDYSCIENKDGNRTVLVVRSHVYWLVAKFFGREGKQQVVVQHGQCRQASSGGSKRADSPCSKFGSVQLLNIPEELIQPEVYGPEIRARLREGNTLIHC